MKSRDDIHFLPLLFSAVGVLAAIPYVDDNDGISGFVDKIYNFITTRHDESDYYGETSRRFYD